VEDARIGFNAEVRTKAMNPGVQPRAIAIDLLADSGDDGKPRYRKRDLRHAGARSTTAPSMTALEFEARLVDWARTLPDLAALVQIGSRVQAGGVVDAWSDWDYQLIVRNPTRYQNRAWPAQIAPCWSTHLERTPRGVMKLSAIFAGGWEADFVLLPAWQMKLVYWAMAHPGLQSVYPPALRQGVANARLMLRPGYRVILGGPAWEQRLAALAGTWPEPAFAEEDFVGHASAFWRHAVWTAKKILRGEVRAAQRWAHLGMREHTYALLAEEARLAGRAPRPEARQAERWLTERQLQQTAMPGGAHASDLARSLLAEMELFREVTREVAKQRGFAEPDYTEVENWLRTELTKLAG
jgi:aminoglycoside 6-adenylyltransferase